MKLNLFSAGSKVILRLGFVGLITLGLFFGLSLVFPHQVQAQSTDELQTIQKQIEELTKKLGEIQAEKNTLASTIRYLDGKIALNEQEIAKTQYEIRITEAQITDLTQRIQGLQTSLVELSTALVDRIQTQYKRRTTDPITMVFATTGVSDLMKEHKYYQKVRAHTQDLLITTEYKRQVYDEEKTAKEKKQAELQALRQRLQTQQADLEQQKQVKRKLLEETNNNERVYQDKLAQAKAELEAINNIVAGLGKETQVGSVNEGEVIAQVIQGRSCNSGGTHLHFIVREGSTVKNPFNYLKPVEHTNCSGSSCGSNNGDAFNPSGDWNWPIEPPIRFSQGYGATWATRYSWVGRIYNFHNGIDINGSSSAVKAVKKGILFRGSYVGSNGCALRYVRVDHDDSNLDTLYLHINY